MDGSLILARNPVWTIKDTDPPDWLNLKWFEFIARAWILLHLLAVARARRKAVFNITWSLEALRKGTYGAFWRQTKTQDKSHLGVRDLCTGPCNSKDLINSGKTGSLTFFTSNSITSHKFKSIRYHRPIALNDTNLILFLKEKVNEEIDYNSKRGRDQIYLPSMALTGIYYPFRIIDFLSWCSCWFGDKICVLRKFSISSWLLDNSKAWRLRTGRFRCWNFPFACVNSFGKSGRWTGAETSSCRTSEIHVCYGQRGAIRTILHWDWHILFRTEGIRIVGGNE